MRLEVVDVGRVTADLPDIQPFVDSLSGVDAIDLLITVSGFEPRVSAIAAALRSAGVEVRASCYLRYAFSETQNAAQRRPLLEALNDLGTEPEAISVDIDEIDFAKEMQEQIRRVSADDRMPVVLLDLSCASGRLLLRVMSVLIESDVDLLVGYAQAEAYYPTKAEYLTWQAVRDSIDVDDPSESPPAVLMRDVTLGLDTGVGDIETPLGYRGQHTETLPDRVVVIPGYNAARPRAALAKIDSALIDNHPSQLVAWLVGEPKLERDAWRLDAVADTNGLRDPNGELVETVTPLSTFDYLATIRTLDAKYLEFFGREQVTIIPLGSKMQTLGVSLFCTMRPDVMVLLALPEQYTDGPYSLGVEALWGIRFGPVDQLRERLFSLGQAVIVADD
ncbi:MAG: hypothetical protein ABIQ09_18805 [Jatrophihabitantaceae bacterium]